MGTFLKIAPQNRPVTFTSVDAGTSVTATTGTFSTASGYFEGTFSGSFIGTLSGSTHLDFETPFHVTASKGFLSFVDNGTLTLVSTGSVTNIFLIQDSTGSAFTINNEGVTILKTFTGSSPSPVQGGIYFTSYDMYIGTGDVSP
ncbi:MAG: hypothetical protein FJ167_05980 [Gammaproteobacteria bacterium]|nr:hypothetical protein [Gammaproteobacteria bacterium]